ncbi:mitochondria-eating protein [Pteropus vampyrus]|uniref:Mitochondria-eating protein n=1 Tax=Pteropus vampyrus TaxID=132908 RepID=A0A6P6CLQ4_PTEVA|nr:mitochondria-eating protein [Pteropus vampyrus]
MSAILALQTNSCDQNLSLCLELIEQVAKVQGQLFGILTTTAQEGGHYDGVEVIKSRLLPWLEASFTAASVGKPVDSRVPSLQDTFDKEKQKESGARDSQLDYELNSTRNQLNQVQDDLAETGKTLEETKNRSSISLLAAEEEINQLRKQLKSLQAQEESRHRNPEHRSATHKSTEQRRTESRRLESRRSEVKAEPRRSEHRRPEQRGSEKRSSDKWSPEATQEYENQPRTLKDRIIYIATVEAFHVAKMAFRHFKIRVRKSLSPSYVGSNDFEDAVSDYIICHLDLYDSQSSVNDVIRAMNVNPKISFPPEVDFCLLNNFIQEICCIAFAMQTLEPPLDIAFGADGEIFNDCKYRRSYDSDYTAPLVFYHVWPALMENDTVIMKGEAVTKRGAFWNSVRSVSRCRSRSLSPIYPRSHIGLSTISRSRSPSPIRCGLPRF